MSDRRQPGAAAFSTPQPSAHQTAKTSPSSGGPSGGHLCTCCTAPATAAQHRNNHSTAAQPAGQPSAAVALHQHSQHQHSQPHGSQPSRVSGTPPGTGVLPCSFDSCRSQPSTGRHGSNNGDAAGGEPAEAPGGSGGSRDGSRQTGSGNRLGDKGCPVCGGLILQLTGSDEGITPGSSRGRTQLGGMESPCGGPAPQHRLAAPRQACAQAHAAVNAEETGCRSHVTAVTEPASGGIAPTVVISNGAGAGAASVSTTAVAGGSKAALPPTQSQAAGTEMHDAVYSLPETEPAATELAEGDEMHTTEPAEASTMQPTELAEDNEMQPTEPADASTMASTELAAVDTQQVAAQQAADAMPREAAAPGAGVEAGTAMLCDEAVPCSAPTRDSPGNGGGEGGLPDGMDVDQACAWPQVLSLELSSDDEVCRTRKNSHKLPASARRRKWSSVTRELFGMNQVDLFLSMSHARVYVQHASAADAGVAVTSIVQPAPSQQKR